MAGNAEVIVVQFLDRFGRNSREILQRYWQLEDFGVQVVTTDEDIKEELLLLIKAGIAGAESKRTSERVRANMSRAVEKGVHAARAPFGLRRIYNGREVGWEKDPVESQVVREMYRLSVEENLGYKAIASDPPMGKRVHFPDLPDAEQVLQNEEHLVLQTDRAGDYSPGDILVGIPWHVCPTSALHRQVFVIDGGELVDRWDVASRDRWITI